MFPTTRPHASDCPPVSAMVATQRRVVTLPSTLRRAKLEALPSAFPTEVIVYMMWWLPLWVLRLLTHSKFAKYAYATLQARVRQLLEDWSLPPDETLQMMRLRNTVISQAAALFTVEPSPWSPSYLTFVCPQLEFNSVRSWMSKRGYEISSSAQDTGTPRHLHRDDMEWEDEDDPFYWDFPHIRYDINDGVRSTVRFIHRATGSCVRLVESYSESPLVPICFFPSTLTMNFISGDGVACLYPKYTSRNKGLLNMQVCPPAPEQDVSLRGIADLSEYQKLGYTFEQSLSDTPIEDCTRSCLDVDTVMMPFDVLHPIRIFPRLEWTLSSRTYIHDGYNDYDPTTRVWADLEEVVYQNEDRFSRETRLAPEALKSKVSSSGGGVN